MYSHIVNLPFLRRPYPRKKHPACSFITELKQPTHMTPVVAFHHQLMCPCNQLQAIVVIKLFADILEIGQEQADCNSLNTRSGSEIAKQNMINNHILFPKINQKAVRIVPELAQCPQNVNMNHPASHLSERVSCSSGRDAPAAAVVGVGPQQVAHGPLVRHLLHAVQLAHVVQRVDGGREAAVQAEDLRLHLTARHRGEGGRTS